MGFFTCFITQHIKIVSDHLINYQNIYVYMYEQRTNRKKRAIYANYHFITSHCWLVLYSLKVILQWNKSILGLLPCCLVRELTRYWAAATENGGRGAFCTLWPTMEKWAADLKPAYSTAQNQNTSTFAILCLSWLNSS